MDEVHLADVSHRHLRWVGHRRVSVILFIRGCVFRAVAVRPTRLCCSASRFVMTPTVRWGQGLLVLAGEGLLEGERRVVQVDLLDRMPARAADRAELANSLVSRVLGDLV